MNVTQVSSSYYQTRSVRATNDAMRRVASGAGSGSSPANVAISDTLSSLISSNDAAGSDLQNAVSMAQTSSGYLNAVGQDLSLMKKLAVQAQGGTLSSADKDSLTAQFKTLQNDMTQITSNYNALASYDGNPLLQGASYSVQAGPNQDQTMTVETSDLSIQSEANAGKVDSYTYDSNNNVVGSSHADVKWGDVVNSVTGLDLSSSDAVGVLNAAISYVSDASSSNGAQISSLISSYNAGAAYSSNLNSALSTDSGEGSASDMIALTKAMLQMQAGTAVQTQANSLSKLSLQLTLLNG